jgi:hypothetical protein
MKYAYVPGSVIAHERAMAGLSAGAPPAPPPYTVLRPAQPYDLATPGTPLGLRQLAAAAREGGLYAGVATLAVALRADGGEVVASLALRLNGDEPGRVRRAWAVYLRREQQDGTVSWAPHGAAVLDGANAARPIRAVGIEQLKAIARGVPYVPPPPRGGPPRLACFHCDRVTPFSITTWRPYTRHRCETSGKEGAS